MAGDGNQPRTLQRVMEGSHQYWGSCVSVEWESSLVWVGSKGAHLSERPGHPTEMLKLCGPWTMLHVREEEPGRVA